MAGDDGDVALQEAAEIAAEQVINYVCSLWKHIQVGWLYSLYLQLVGDDGNVELQQVIEEQIRAGQGENQMSSQEFENRFFLS